MTELFTLVISLTDKLMGQLPDYEQGKKEKFYKMKKDYEEELLKDYPFRDDLLIDSLRDKLRLYLEVFLKEIQ